MVDHIGFIIAASLIALGSIRIEAVKISAVKAGLFVVSSIFHDGTYSETRLTRS